MTLRIFEVLPALLQSYDTRAQIMSLLTPPPELESHRVKLYRDYIAGRQKDPLSEAQRDMLAEDIDYTLNICATVVEVPANRLKLLGVEVGNLDDEVQSQINTKLRQIWDLNRMDEYSSKLHFNAGRDGDSFLVVDYADGKVRYTVNSAYDGNTGVYAVYGHDDAHEPLYCVKEWVEIADRTLPTKRNITRRNVYYHNRVEKWVKDAKQARSDWSPLDENDIQQVVNEDGLAYAATLVWWTDTGTQDGVALGIPVLHFRAGNGEGSLGKSDLADIVPGVQDGINIANAMLSAASQLQGTPLSVFFANSNTQRPDTVDYFPGAMIWVPGGGAIGSTPVADLDKLNGALDAQIRRAATLTSIPTYLFNLSGQIAAEGTQQQMEIMLLAKVERRQVTFGNRYEDMARLTLKLLTAFDPEFIAFGVGEFALKAIDDLSISAKWQSAEIRDENRDIEAIALKLTQLGIPREQAWREVGYTDEQIEQMSRDLANSVQLRSAGDNAVAAALAAALAGGNSNDVDTPTTRTITSVDA